MSLFGGGSERDGKPRVACRICRLARIHIFLVVLLLAAWRIQPALFDWAAKADRYLVPMAIVGAVVILFIVKWWQYRSSRPRR